MPGLIDIGKGNIENAGYSAEEDEDAPIRYIHIQACGKGGVAAADGGFAERLYNHAIKFAARQPEGFVNFQMTGCVLK